MIRYVLEFNNKVYLKEDKKEGRILCTPLHDTEGLKNEILTKGYKTIQGAKKGAKKLLQVNPGKNIVVRGLIF